MTDEAPGRLPTFLLIGAMKAGTTSLYHYLREHPQVFMPAVKAPEFFAGRAHWARGVHWYRGLFAAAAPGHIAIGEASNVYTKYPTYTGVPARIASHIPDVKLVYVVRDPVERIRSHYQTRVAEGIEKKPFEEAVFTNPIYLDYSRYGLQLAQYLEHFDRDQLLVVTAEDLRDERRATIRRVYSFLGVDVEFVPPGIERTFYRTTDRASRSPIPLWLRKSLKKRFPAAKRAKELENNIFGALKRLRRERADPRPALVVSAGVRARIVDALAEDVQRLRLLLGPEFDGWGIPAVQTATEQ